jgi:hypothetical protein
MGHITLSPKHGLGLVISQCFYCGEGKEIMVFGSRAYQLENEYGQLPMQLVFDKVPCKKCQEALEVGVLLISIRNNEPQSDNPYRTGGVFCIKTEAWERIMGENYKPSEKILFIEDQALNTIRMPTPEDSKYRKAGYDIWPKDTLVTLAEINKIKRQA